MSKRPAFQFYPGDWRTDPGLRLCSIGARGLWIEMMTLMHEGEPYGHLTMQGRPIEPDMLARLCGEPLAIVKRLLKELDLNEVFSRTGAGILFSRRMVRDEDARERRAEIGRTNGMKGGEFGYRGSEYGKKGGRPRKENPPEQPGEKPPQEPGQNPRPSSSSPSPSAEEKVPLANANGSAVDPDRQFWDGAKAYLGKSKASMIGKWCSQYGQPDTAKAIAAAQVARAFDPIAYIEMTLRQATSEPALPVVGL